MRGKKWGACDGNLLVRHPRPPLLAVATLLPCMYPYLLLIGSHQGELCIKNKSPWWPPFNSCREFGCYGSLKRIISRALSTWCYQLQWYCPGVGVTGIAIFNEICVFNVRFRGAMCSGLCNFNAYLNILLSIQNFSNFKVFLVISKQSTLVDGEDLGILGVLRKILGLGVINPARWSRHSS